MRETSVVYDPDPAKRMKKEEKRATRLLKGRSVKKIRRFSPTSVLIEFEDGARFFIDIQENELDLSITGNFNEDE